MLNKSFYSLILSLVITTAAVPSAFSAITTNLKTREIEVSGEGDKAPQALQDAREKALNSALSNLIQTEGEREKLKRYLPTLYQNAETYLKRLKIVGKGTTRSGGRFYKILYRVDIEALKTTLIQQNIVPKQSDVNEALDFPTLAVYFKDPLNTSDAALWSIQRCNSLLLDEGFKIIDPKVWEKLAREDLKLSQVQQVNVQRTALNAKANVFLEISLDPEVAGKSGDYTYIHAPVRVRAFESSSGQAFLDKSYARLDKQGHPEAFAIKGSLDTSTKVVVEEALAGVMPMIVKDLNIHWKSSLSQGRQYRLFFSPPLNAAQTQLLQSKVKAYKRQSKSEIYIRYAGELSELADELEEALEPDYTLQSVDLGQAHFHKIPKRLITVEKQFAELSNLAMMLLIFSIIPFAGFFGYIFLKSPLFSPIYLLRANRAYTKKKYEKAAKLYEKVHDFESIRKGNIYAKKAAQSHEFSGKLRLSRDWYAKAGDYTKVGALMVEAGQIDDAIALYKEENMPQRLALLYENEERFLEAAYLYRELKQPRKEESLYRKAILKGDTVTIQTARFYLARLQYQNNRYEEAKSVFEQANLALPEIENIETHTDLLKLRDETALSLQSLF